MKETAINFTDILKEKLPKKEGKNQLEQKCSEAQIVEIAVGVLEQILPLIPEEALNQLTVKRKVANPDESYAKNALYNERALKLYTNAIQEMTQSGAIKKNEGVKIVLAEIERRLKEQIKIFYENAQSVFIPTPPTENIVSLDDADPQRNLLISKMPLSILEIIQTYDAKKKYILQTLSGRGIWAKDLNMLEKEVCILLEHLAKIDAPSNFPEIQKEIDHLLAENESLINLAKALNYEETT